MTVVAEILIGLVAVMHLGFLSFEMFAWQRFGPKLFRRFPPELFRLTVPMMANQGLYNGFLAAGLVWSLIAEGAFGRSLAIFFLSCVIVAGLFGAATVSRRIAYVQAAPAAIALLFVWLS
ncbi:hypothetical protein DEA8626_02208 [Defluviimonas aquaemixtae]|uniref:DUF1304 domain-containing protein n=1 Tax=Albidovulum aquaemixtae TaxID=1542388 RepID=A0A2R8B7X3_9RHOB|nr:DUF1304 domain-containing protein [Defluviimonas aquaemixtae]SPH18666.1 hypothetical protein DEA8626_02208 [Defluviimonas aquaemixtae]